MTHAKKRGRLFSKLVATASIGALAAIACAAPAGATVVRDDVGVDAAVDEENEWAGVGQMFNRVLNPDNSVSTFLCTGSLINPRTVVFAQHCVGAPDAAYDPGVGNHMGFGFNPTDTFTGFDDWRRDDMGNILNPITGQFESLPDQHFYNVLQVQTPFNDTEFFPGGDVAIASFDTPVIGLPTYGMLFSPLSGPTHGVVGGYGTTGIGSTGDVVPIDFKRRMGENMIDGLFSQNDFIAAEFGVPGFGFGDASSAQLLYHIDFDRPDRNPNDCLRGEFFGTGNGNDLVCFTPPFGPIFTLDGSSGVRISDHINWYGGDALPNEVGTAGGDSGSALFADEIHDRPLITGVLSGGWINGVGSPLGGYGDVSYYNPLFLFRDWLVENNPYVYASARHGSRNWSNPNHWVQNMDPNYFYIDQHGRVRNGLPAATEPGYFADDPKWGTVFDTDVSGGFGDEGPDLYLCELDNTFPCPPGVSASGGGNQFASNGLVQMEHHGEDPLAAGEPGDRHEGPTATNSGPTGPGSRGFVPNNSYGTFGTWSGSADGTARFFDVTLNNVGITTLDIDVEIDNLAVSGLLSVLNVRSGRQLNSLVAVDQFSGLVNVDGHVNTREYMLWGGLLSGRGHITADTLFNVNGLITAADFDSVGSLTINGDYVQTSQAAMVVNTFRHGNNRSNDFIQVNGAASLDGDVIVVPVNMQSKPKWKDVYTVLNATDGVVGDFDDIALLLASPTLYGESVVHANGDVDIEVRARHAGQILGQGHWLHSFASAIDALRFGGHYGAFENLFDIVDSGSFGNFEGALFSLTPTNAFETLPLAVEYTQNFTLGLEGRTAELRSGVRGVSQRSLLNGLRIAQAGQNGDEQSSGLSTSETRPLELGDRVGFFISGRGNLSAVGDEAFDGDRYNPAHMTAFSSADMTVGADYRVSDNFAIGVATTLSRYLSRNDQAGITPMEHSGYGAMLYASTWSGNWFVDSYVGVARHDYAMARTPGFNQFGEVDAAPGAVQSLAGVRGGWVTEPIAGLSLGPSVALRHSRYAFDGYREIGGGDLALEVDGRSLESTALETALDFTYRPFASAGRAAPFAAYGRVGFVSELGDSADMVHARFAAAPDIAFDIGRELDREWITSSLGMSYQFGPNASAHLEAVADTDRGVLSNTSVQAGFSLRF